MGVSVCAYLRWCECACLISSMSVKSAYVHACVCLYVCLFILSRMRVRVRPCVSECAFASAVARALGREFVHICECACGRVFVCA